jgi:hypothetical protein
MQPPCSFSETARIFNRSFANATNGARSESKSRRWKAEDRRIVEQYFQPECLEVPRAACYWRPADGEDQFARGVQER